MNLKAQLCLLLPGLTLLCGCLHLPASRDDRRPPPVPLPASASAAAACPLRKVAVLRETELATNGHYRVRRIELMHPDKNGSTNVLDYYQLPGGPRPVILVLPVAGGRRYEVEGIFARYFAERGFAVVIAHRRRVAQEFNLAAIDPWVLDTIWDNQRVLDWIETRPELDGNRIGLFGISLGGIRGVLLAAVDSRIKTAVFGLAGGDLAYVATHSSERGAVRRRNSYMLKHGLTPEQLETQLRGAITCEPNVFATHIDPRKVMLVLACFDKSVPFAKGWELRSYLGEPETLLLPTGHYTAVLAVPTIQWESLRFLRRQLGIEPSLAVAGRLRSPRDESARSVASKRNIGRSSTTAASMLPSNEPPSSGRQSASSEWSAKSAPNYVVGNSTGVQRTK